MSKTKYQKNNLHRILMTGARYKIQESQKTWPDASGIYAIKNTVTGKSYIGSAISFKSRWKTHRTLLRGNRHHSKKLQSSWNKHGEDKFVFLVLCPVDAEYVIDAEQLWLDQSYAAEIGYNIAPIAANRTGLKHSEETKRKMSNTRIGKKMNLSDEQRAERRSRTHTEDARKRISEWHKNKVVSMETRMKMSAIAKSRVRSPETRAKQSASLKAAHAKRIANEKGI